MFTEISAPIPYTIDSGEKLVNETFGPNNIRRHNSGTHAAKKMSVRNGRLLSDPPTLEREGFILVSHPTKVKDFFDPRELEAVYYPELQELIKRESGSSRVVIFDHTLRSGNEEEREEKLINSCNSG